MPGERAGLKIRPASHFEIVNPENDRADNRDYWTTLPRHSWSGAA